VNLGQLPVLFAQHKTAVLGAAAAGVTGLALYQRRKGTAGAGATTGGATVPGTIPAAAVIPAGGSIGGGYDSTSYDLYNALQPEISQILQQQQSQQTGGTAGGGVKAAPAPIASTLLSPTYSGKYVRWADGQIDEVERDGSLLWLNPSESKKAFGGKTWVGKVNQLTQKAPATVYNTGKNLIAKNTPATPAKK